MKGARLPEDAVLCQVFDDARQLHVENSRHQVRPVLRSLAR